MNKEVNFEIAKLLKEKGFPQLNTGLYYTKDKEHCLVGWGFNDRTEESFAQYSAPTIAEVVMWLYEKHGIWIGVELTDNTTDFYFQQTIWTSKDRDWNDTDMVDQAKSICKWKEWRYNSPTEAYSSAIEYTLKNLI